MVNKDHQLSVRRQCKLLTLTRSNLYYEPKSESAENAAVYGDDRQEILGNTLVRLAPNGPVHEAQQPRMRAASCPAFDALHAVGSDLPGTQHQQKAPAGLDLAISSEKRGDWPSKPGLVCRYYLHTDAAWFLVSRGNYGLAQPKGAGMAALQQHGRRVLRGGAERGIGQSRHAGDIQHRSGKPVHQWRLDRRAE